MPWLQPKKNLEITAFQAGDTLMSGQHSSSAVIGDQLIGEFGITLKESEQGDGVTGNDPTIHSQNNDHFYSCTQLC